MPASLPSRSRGSAASTSIYRPRAATLRRSRTRSSRPGCFDLRELRLNTGTRVGDLVDVSGPREGGGVGASDAGAATFDSDLRLLRRRVVRRWALALAVRCAIVAL